MLISEGVSKSNCDNEFIITDTTEPGLNAINSSSWYTATDNEGVGSKVIKEATLENGAINTKMYVGNFSYPDGPWSSGKLTGDIGYNINDYDYIKITYKSTIDLIFELPISSLDSDGKNFGKRIDATNEYSTLILDINTFEKPTWAISDITPLDKSKVSTVSLRTLLADGEDVEISVKEVVFYKKTITSEIDNLGLSNFINNIKIEQFNNSLHIHNNLNFPFRYKIISLNGKTINEGILINSFKSSNKIDNPSLSSGVYLFNIISNDKCLNISRRFKWVK